MATIVDELVTRLSLIGLEEYGNRFQKASKSMAAWTAVAVAGGTAATFAGKQIIDAYKAAADEQARFQTASDNFKGSLPLDELEELSTRLSRLTAVEDSTIAGTVGLLGTFGMLGSEAKQLILPLLNSTRALEASGKSSEGLAEAVGKAFQMGNVSGLRRMGIFVDEVAFKTNRLQAIMDALQAQGGDAAIKFGQSAAGGLQRGKNAIDDLQEAIGGRFLNALAPALESATKFTEAIADNSTAATAAAVVLGGAVVGGTVAATVATWRLYTAVTALGNAYTSTGSKAAAASSKMGGKGAGIGGILGGLAGGLGGELLAGQGAAEGGVMGGLKTIGGRAAQGAGIGGMFGLKGAAIGGIAGALAGSVENILRGSGIIKSTPAATTSPELAELKKQTKALETMAGSGGQAVDYNRLSIAQQRAIMAYGVAIG